MKNIVPSIERTAYLTRDVPRLSLTERIISGWFRKVRFGRLNVEFPSGRSATFEGLEAGPQATIRIRDYRLLWRILASGDIGFAEGYMERDWDSPDLKAVMAFGAMNQDTLTETFASSRLVNLLNRLRHGMHANTRKGSRRNIAAHYDLGNDFYRCWLDETMSYSSAIFEDMDEPHETAQHRKYRRLAQRLDLEPGDRVLEIGCGWGGFAEIAAAEFGCEVVGITLSQEQAAFARARMEREGLADRVEIRLQDYRDLTGEFDKIVSIEMFEAVGQENWQTFFDVLDRCLKPGGKAGLQVITIADGQFEAYRRTPDFIQLYIFPGGMLPSPTVFEKAVSDAGLTVSDRFYFGKSYAESLRRWNREFLDNWRWIQRIGFDCRFFDMWTFYLHYCEVGFDMDRIDVGQFVIERP